MNYAGIVDCSIVDGSGFRVVLFVSGCTHNCEGCHNPETHSHLYGKPFTKNVEETLIKLLDRSYIKGITISGGDPLSIYNRGEVIMLAKRLKDRFPEKDIWCYTGYTIKELQEQGVCLDFFDVIVDGPFKPEYKQSNLKFRGSSNQNIVELHK